MDVAILKHGWPLVAGVLIGLMVATWVDPYTSAGRVFLVVVSALVAWLVLISLRALIKRLAGGPSAE